MEQSPRNSGISQLGGLSWGTAFNHFFRAKKDLLDILVPYFKAGLEDNEFCLWHVSAPLSVEEARAALKKAISGFDRYWEEGRLSIVPGNRLKSKRKAGAEAVISALDKALFEGFDGLRFAAGADVEDESDVLEYLGAEAICGDLAVAAFAFPYEGSGTAKVLESVRHRRPTLALSGGKWKLFVEPERRGAAAAAPAEGQEAEEIVRNMSEGFGRHRIVIDSEGTPRDYIFLEINEAFEKLTGLKAKHILGKRATEVLPGLQRDRMDWIGKYGRVALGGKPVSFENFSDSLRRWYAVRAFSPRRSFFITLFTDVTSRFATQDKLASLNEELSTTNEELRVEIEHRAKMEEALRHSEEKFSIMFEAAPIAMSLASFPDGSLFNVNKAWLDLTGYASNADVKGRTSIELGLMRDEEQSSRLLDEFRRSGSVRDAEVVFHTVSGARRTTLVSIDKIIIGDLQFILSTNIDITERKRMERALRESKERYRELVTTANSIIIKMERGGTLTFFNEYAQKFFGYSLEEALGKNVRMLVPPIENGSKRDLGAMIDALLTNPDGWSENINENVLKNGDRVWISWRNKAVRDSGGNVIGNLAVGQDITARKHAEDELKRRVEELRAVNDDLARFNRVMVDRELKMIELKTEINGLCERIGEEPRYRTDFEDENLRIPE